MKTFNIHSVTWVAFLAVSAGLAAGCAGASDGGGEPPAGGGASEFDRLLERESRDDEARHLVARVVVGSEEVLSIYEPEAGKLAATRVGRVSRPGAALPEDPVEAFEALSRGAPAPAALRAAVARSKGEPAERLVASSREVTVRVAPSPSVEAAGELSPQGAFSAESFQCYQHNVQHCRINTTGWLIGNGDPYRRFNLKYAVDNHWLGVEFQAHVNLNDHWDPANINWSFFDPAGWWRDMWVVGYPRVHFIVNPDSWDTVYHFSTAHDDQP